jgi:hypothetical protein
LAKDEIFFDRFEIQTMLTQKILFKIKKENLSKLHKFSIYINQKPTPTQLIPNGQTKTHQKQKALTVCKF